MAEFFVMVDSFANELKAGEEGFGFDSIGSRHFPS